MERSLTRAQTVDIGGGRGRLSPDAAASLARVDRALGRPIDVNSAWRDPVTQDAMYRAWTAYANGTGPKPWHGRAIPSSVSVHCRGRAIDTDDRPIELLKEHGWIRVASDEPWHFEYATSRDRHYGEPTGTETAIPDETEDEGPMNVITVSSAGVKYELKNGRKRSISKAEWTALRALEKVGLELNVAVVDQATINGIPGK